MVTYAVYLIQVFWPKDLAFFYPHPGHGQPPAQVFGALLLLVSITLLVLKALRGHPYMAVGWLWYLGMLTPLIGLIQVGVQARADRRPEVSVGREVAMARGRASAILG